MKSIWYILRDSSVRTFFLSVVCVMCLQVSAVEQDYYMQRAVITDKNLREFLTQYIVPVAKANNYDVETDEIILTDGKRYNRELKRLENDIAIIITADCSAGFRSFFNSEDKVYVAELKGINFYIRYNGYDDSWFKILPDYKFMGKVDTDGFYGRICDATWLLLTDSGRFRLINFHDMGLRWLKGREYRTFRPELPVKRVKYGPELSELTGIKLSKKTELPKMIEI